MNAVALTKPASSARAAAVTLAAITLAVFGQTVRGAGHDEPVHFSLAGTLAQAGRIQEAMAEYHTALQLKSKDIEALNNLAWLLASAAPASLRDGAETVQLATSANQLASGKNAATFGTLAPARAETGQFDEACRKADDAIARALAARLKNDLKVYQSGHSLSHP